MAQQTPPPNDPDDDYTLTSSEVAGMFRVSPKTVTRWAKLGLLPYRRTLGGHRRFSERRVREELDKRGSATW